MKTSIKLTKAFYYTSQSDNREYLCDEVVRAFCKGKLPQTIELTVSTTPFKGGKLVLLKDSCISGRYKAAFMQKTSIFSDGYRPMLSALYELLKSIHVTTRFYALITKVD